MYEYYKKGYWNVVIRPKVEGKDSFLFQIKENAPSVVDIIKIKDQQIDQNLDTSDFFSALFKNKIFD